MAMTRRGFLRTAVAAGAALTLPLVPAVADAARRWLGDRGEAASAEACDRDVEVRRPTGPPGFEPWWVQTFLATKLWPSADETVEPLETVEHRAVLPGRGAPGRVPGAGLGPAREPIWLHRRRGDRPRRDAALGGLLRGRPLDRRQPDDPAAHRGDAGRHAGLQRPGDGRLATAAPSRAFTGSCAASTTRRWTAAPSQTRRNATCSRTCCTPSTSTATARRSTTTGGRSAWGYPGSQGCLGMRMDGAKFIWEWAGVGTPLAIHY